MNKEVDEQEENDETQERPTRSTQKLMRPAVARAQEAEAEQGEAAAQEEE